jgi:hypothetical protein
MEQDAEWKTHHNLWYWTCALLLLIALMIFNYTHIMHQHQIGEAYADEDVMPHKGDHKTGEEHPLITESI